MSELIGYLAAIVACISFGSFAVPIKGRVANEINIDPLVMQTYKTAMCFATSWFVLLSPHVTFHYTPWGLVSGLFWIPGGTAGIYAVRNAGLAVSQGTWSALKVAIGFSWGLFIFHEPVRSTLGASTAIVMLIAGLWSMSYYSSLSRKPERQLCQSLRLENQVEVRLEESLPIESEEDMVQDGIMRTVSTHVMDADGAFLDPKLVDFCCMKVSKRTLGIMCAFFDGIWGGSILVPMHFAKTSTEGLGYVISFAIGATTVLIVLWIIRITYNVVLLGSVSKAVSNLPGLHLKAFWFQGGLAGLLWSIGNMSSMISVQYLGEGVGYSIVQAQMLVAGLYGVLLYREVQGWHAILGWFFGAFLTLSGILLLTHEHVRGHR